MNKIWVPSVATEKFDLADTAKFGQITPIFNKVSPLRVEELMTIVRRDVLPNGNRNDFILVAGPSIMVTTLTALWFDHFKVARLLSFCMKHHEYVERILDQCGK